MKCHYASSHMRNKAIDMAIWGCQNWDSSLFGDVHMANFDKIILLCCAVHSTKEVCTLFIT